MRDYAEIVARLIAQGDELSLEAAKVIGEFRELCDKMTQLGVDLEEQVAEQLEPEIFWDYSLDESSGEGSLVAILENHQDLNIVKVRRARFLSDVWAVRLPGFGTTDFEQEWNQLESASIQYFYSEEEAVAARTEFYNRCAKAGGELA